MSERRVALDGVSVGDWDRKTFVVRFNGRVLADVAAQTETTFTLEPHAAARFAAELASKAEEAAKAKDRAPHEIVRSLEERVEQRKRDPLP